MVIVAAGARAVAAKEVVTAAVEKAAARVAPRMGCPRPAEPVDWAPERLEQQQPREGATGSCQGVKIEFRSLGTVGTIATF